MKHPFLRLLFGVLLVSSVCSMPTFGRIFKVWDYDELVSKSDLVAILQPLENKAATDTFPGYTYGHSTNDFEAANTRFKVHAVLKGTDPFHPKPGLSKDELTLLHFGYSKGVMIMNGAHFIRFLDGTTQYEKRFFKDGKPGGGATIRETNPTWLAFLKRREDGRFEPITGHYDSALSFRELLSFP